jgi:hypothetical protein
MHTGTLIDALFAAVEHAEKAAEKEPHTASLTENSSQASPHECGIRQPSPAAHSNPIVRKDYSEPEEFPQPLGLCAADWYLGLLLIIHAQLIRALEPRNNLADAIDVHEVRAMRPPEKIAV